MTISEQEFSAVRLKLAAAQGARPEGAESGGEFIAAAALSRELTARAMGAALLSAGHDHRAAYDVMQGFMDLQRKQRNLEKYLEEFAAELSRLTNRGVTP